MDCSEYLELVKQKTFKVEKVSWKENADLCMVYVEFRKLDIIPWNLYNIAKVYGGTDTSLVILHSKVNRDIIKETTKNWNGVKLIEFTQDESSIADYNKFFTSVNFWKLFEKHKFVLINQWDSFLFRKIPQKFFNYDYVGAPCGHVFVLRNTMLTNLCSDTCRCGNCTNKQSTFDYQPCDVVYSMLNGGLSLRKVSAMIDLCRKKAFRGESEDVYFCLSYLYKPSRHEAKEFSVQDFTYDLPVGCHKIWENQHKEYILKLFNNNDS